MKDHLFAWSDGVGVCTCGCWSSRSTQAEAKKAHGRHLWDVNLRDARRGDGPIRSHNGHVFQDRVFNDPNEWTDEDIARTLAQIESL